MVRFDELVYEKRQQGALEKFAVQATMQQVVLCGLADGGFFRHAAFYGGTCLKLFHGLNRFSEDLDFTLLELGHPLALTSYFEAVTRAFLSVGREVEVRKIGKSVLTDTESAIVKTETQAFQIGVRNAPKTTVKFEIDTNPAIVYPSETKFLHVPDPHAITCCTLEGLMVGKVSACLFRTCKNRIKGRDWFDLAWYVARRIPLQRALLQRVTQRGHPVEAARMVDGVGLRKLLDERIECIDFDQARQDVYPFVDGKSSLDIWSPTYFHSVVADLVIA